MFWGWFSDTAWVWKLDTQPTWSANLVPWHHHASDSLSCIGRLPLSDSQQTQAWFLCTRTGVQIRVFESFEKIWESALHQENPLSQPLLQMTYGSTNYILTSHLHPSSHPFLPVSSPAMAPLFAKLMTWWTSNDHLGLIRNIKVGASWDGIG